MEFKFIKVVVFVPSSHADKIRAALAEAGAGKLGDDYDNCSFSVKGIGRFRGLGGSKPFIGKAGEITEVEEERIETICPNTKLYKVLEAIKEVHPYEEPAVDIYPMLNTGKL